MNFEIIVGIVVIVSVIGISIATIFPALKKRGINTEKIIETAETILSAVDTATETMKDVFPEIPLISLMDKIVDWAVKGVESAEQLYKTSTITGDQRKEKAVRLVKDCLTTAKIEITPELLKVIDGCVEAAVFSLPKTSNALSVSRR